MSTPRVELISVDGVKFVFTYTLSMRFTAAVYSSSGDTVCFFTSLSAFSSLHSLDSFRVSLDLGFLFFPISELEKFDDFLEVVENAKEAA